MKIIIHNLTDEPDYLAVQGVAACIKEDHGRLWVRKVGAIMKLWILDGYMVSMKQNKASQTFTYYKDKHR